jgi:hypothetical protein
VADGSVILAYVHDHEVAHCWHRSVLGLVRHDARHEGRVAGDLLVRCGFQGVPAARNEGVRRFLATEGIDWLLWTDTDMGFTPDTVDRLLAAADPIERPVVGALCFAQKLPEDDGLNGYRSESIPTIYQWHSDEEFKGFVNHEAYPPDELIRVAGTGSACILVHRRVFECISATQPGSAWYEPVPNPTTGGVTGEDLSFCLRCAVAGIPVHVHTGIRTNHMKHVWLSDPLEVTATP